MVTSCPLYTDTQGGGCTEDDDEEDEEEAAGEGCR